VLDWARSGHGTPALGNAAIWAVAAPADDEAVSRLLELKDKIAHKNLRAWLEEVIASIAGASGVSPDEIADRQTPDHGLDENGRRTWDLQGYRVTLRLTSAGAVEREIIDPRGQERKSVPSTIRQESSDVWTALGWRDSIGRHPVLASLARRLVWQIELPTAGERVLGMPAASGWQDHQARLLDVPDDASLSIAHPVQVPHTLQESWQRCIVEKQIVQPFKQLFRET
jgi:hypothetical protein